MWLPKNKVILGGIVLIYMSCPKVAIIGTSLFLYQSLPTRIIKII